MAKTRSLRQKWHVPPIPGSPFLELCASNARETAKKRLYCAANAGDFGAILRHKQATQRRQVEKLRLFAARYGSSPVTLRPLAEVVSPEEARKLRRFFCEADFSQQETRVLALLSEELEV